MLKTVNVPKEFEHLFKKAEEDVGKYFSLKTDSPTEGKIEIGGERYVLVRAASLSTDFFETVKNLYKDKGSEKAHNIASQMLFDIAHSIGKSDAKFFFEKMNLKDPIEKLSAGPVHFSYAGWAFVDIMPESRPSPDENYYLIYDHPYSFEADAWRRIGKESDFPVCIMNAGYSSGWCEESFGISLIASEILCRAKGDKVCRFIMAPPSRIDAYIKEYLKGLPESVGHIERYEIPGFFKRKQLEDELRGERDSMKTYLDIADVIVVAIGPDGKVAMINNKGCEILGYKEEEIVGKNWFDNFVPARTRDRNAEIFRELMLGEVSQCRREENYILTKNGEEKVIAWKSEVLRNVGGKKNSSILSSGMDITERVRIEKELMKKMNDLEKFQKFSVDRELKMIELKGKLKELGKKLGKSEK